MLSWEVIPRLPILTRFIQTNLSVNTLNLCHPSPPQSKTKLCVFSVNASRMFAGIPLCGSARAQKSSCAHLVDPGDDGILGVIRQLLEVLLAAWGLGGRVSANAGHHPLHAHHLHRVCHHQRVDERQVGALQKTIQSNQRFRLTKNVFSQFSSAFS